MISPTDHRGAFRAAVSDGRECACIASGCFMRASQPCSLCTADFIQDHPCPAMYPEVYYIGGSTPVMLDGGQSSMTWVAIRYGQCCCESSKCLPECAACAAGSFHCPEGRHVRLRAHEHALRTGYESGELPCPYGTSGGNCSTADGRWYHGDCVPRDAQVPALATYSDVAVAPEQDGAEVALARHLDRLAEALGIVGAEDDIDMYEAVEALHREIDRLRKSFGRVAYVLQVALDPHASSDGQPWKGARRALELARELAQTEVNNATGKGKSDVPG